MVRDTPTFTSSPSCFGAYMQTSSLPCFQTNNGIKSVRKVVPVLNSTPWHLGICGNVLIALHILNLTVVGSQPLHCRRKTPPASIIEKPG